ncbi:MAG: hypothetical protein CW338_10625 [Clostridiales bacterium]|nr:hypothetical protein [Clostridiales bacterium]
MDKKKVLVLNGSPKPVSDTMQLTGAFLKGLNAEDKYDVKIINVIEKNVQPCRGCFACMHSNEVFCPIEDDMREILSDIMAADVLIWSFPLYCYAMPSHLKAVLDRILPLNHMTMVKESDGRVHHAEKADVKEKKILVISGCGFPNWEGNFDGLRIMCRNCFGDAPVICVPETPMMNVPAAAPAADPLRARFTAAGVEFDQTGTLSPQTSGGLEWHMIPAEQYIAIVNSNG